jgi:hypothetical protein
MTYYGSRLSASRLRRSLGSVFVGLIHEPRWDPGDEAPETPRRRSLPRGFWRPLVWLAVWLWMFVLAGIVASAIGALAGYVVVLAAVALAAWRVDRWCARQYWGGLREWHG